MGRIRNKKADDGRAQRAHVIGRPVWGLGKVAYPGVRDSGLGPINLSYMEKSSGYRWPLHHHRNLVEFYYVDKGRVTVSLGGERHMLGQGQGIFLLPGRNHAIEGAVGTPTNVLVIHFAADKAIRMIPDIRRIAGFPLTPGAEGFRLLGDLARNVSTGGKYVHLKVGANLLELIVELVDSRADAPARPRSAAGIPPGRGGLAGQVERYVRENYRKNLPLALIARELHFSVSTLVHRYRKETGETPHRLVLRCRMERAKELLRNSGIPVKTVAHESGFSSAVSFIRGFRSLEKMTPGAYRKMLPG